MNNNPALPFIQPLGTETIDQDFVRLRLQAIEEIRSLASGSWTDHNYHDPGITAIEALCFAITEHGHLNTLPIGELLGVLGKMDALKKDFFQPEEVLHNAPVTVNDWRKFLIDFDFIKNAWLFPSANYQYNADRGYRVEPKGLYDVLLEWSPDEFFGELNGNILSVQLSVTQPNGIIKTYWADLIFPFTWDTPEVEYRKFLHAISILSITLTTANPLHTQLDPHVESPGVYFSDLVIQYNTSETITLGIILRLQTETTTELERKVVEDAFIAAISDPGGPVFTFNQMVSKAFRYAQLTRETLLDKRNLAEDFLKLYAVNIQEIGIQCELELIPGTNVESVLAELFYVIDDFISPEFIFESYDTASLNSDSEPDFREGPLLSHGYLSDDQLQRIPGKSIFLSDLLHLMLEGLDKTRHENIIAVYNLSLQSYINNKPAGKSEENCIRLVEDFTYRPRLNIFKSQILVRERGIIKPYNISEVYTRFKNLKSNVELLKALAPMPSSSDDLVVINPASGYYPVQYEFPSFFDLSINEKTPVNIQMRGYLFFFEQLLANQSTLLSHSTQILSVANTETETRFPANIRQLLPFYDDYLKNTYESVLATDDAENNSRRSLLLDHLLARLGEDFRYYGSWNNLNGAALTKAKYDFLRAIPGLAANRFGSFNYEKPSWNTTNTTTVHKKLVHLLQLPDQLSSRRWRSPVPNFSIINVPGPPSLFGFRITDSANNPFLKSASDTFEFEFEAENAATSVIQYGRAPVNYQILSNGSQFQFVIIDNELEIIAISENLFATEVNAQAAIKLAVSYFSGLWVPEEGLHVLELLLLRPQTYTLPALKDRLLQIPIQPDGANVPGFANDLYSHQILVVLPNTGDRFGDPVYQEVATAVIQKEFPAWLQVRIVWLNIFKMNDFENAYHDWVTMLSDPTATETVRHSTKAEMVKVVNTIYDMLAKITMIA